MEIDVRLEVLAVILAGGMGKRLAPLTRDRAKPAVPFGGGYRIVDFTLSNCFNSGLRKILLLTQYKATSLDRHVATGWSPYFCRATGEFIDILPPQQRIGADWYQGTANAVYQNIYSIEREAPRHVLILAGDHIYRMDYGKMLAFHLECDADLTVAAIPVPVRAARGALGVLEIERDRRIRRFEEKPAAPKEIPNREGWALGSMGIYIFKAGFLFEELCRDATLTESRHDFGADIIPRVLESNRVFAYPFQDENGTGPAYWRDVGTLDNYYETSMDLVSVEPHLNLYNDRWPIYTHQPNDPPAKFVFAENRRRGEAHNSLVCAGTIIAGGCVEHSILGHRVRVNDCAQIEDSILFSDVEIGRLVRLRRTIVDRGTVIADGRQIGFDPELDRQNGCCVTESGITVVQGTVR